MEETLLSQRLRELSSEVLRIDFDDPLKAIRLSTKIIEMATMAARLESQLDMAKLMNSITSAISKRNSDY